MLSRKIEILTLKPVGLTRFYVNEECNFSRPDALFNDISMSTIEFSITRYFAVDAHDLKAFLDV